MKKYIKPEIKVNYFDAKDVIATSCICTNLDSCWHLENGILFSHNGSNAYFNPNFYSSSEYCPEHGSIYRSRIIPG